METAPIPLDVQEFQFKLHCKLKIFNELGKNTLEKNPNLICAASQHGLVFVGYQNQLKVLRIDTIENTEKGSEVDSFEHRAITLASVVTHVAVNCDGTLLSVVLNQDNGITAMVYDVSSFLSQSVKVKNELRLSSTPGSYLADICWNPGVANILAVCVSDGSVGVYEVKQNEVQINTLPPMSQSKCLCWSPKGKQIVIGSANGSISQYKPELKIVKTFPAPILNNSQNITILNILWISNYQFLGAYKNNEDSSSSYLVLVNTPKSGGVTYMNFDDICYSNGTIRPSKFYLIHQQAWNVILAASANSMEVGVLGLVEGSAGTAWQQWTQSDNARAELPLSATTKEETYPVGFALDTGSTREIPWGENQKLSPMPMLYVLSHEGLLNVFVVINLRKEAVNVCVPPQAVQDQTGLQFFTKDKNVNPVVLPTLSPVQITKPSSLPTTSNTSFTSLSSSQPPGNKLSFSFAAATSTPIRPQQQQQPPSQTTNQSTLFDNRTESVPGSQPSLFTNITGTQSTQASSLFGTKLQTSSTSTLSQTTEVTKPATSLPQSVFQPTSLFENKPTTQQSALTSSQTAFQPSSRFSNGESTNQQSSLLSSIPLAKPIISVVTIGKSSPPNASKPIATVQQPAVTELSEKSKDNSLTISLITEELMSFQSELNLLLTRCRQVEISVGSDEDKNRLVEKCQALFTFFFEDLLETTETQMNEVFDLKRLLLETFALHEEADSRYKRLINPQYLQLCMQSIDLDPISSKKLADIRRLICYVDSQLQQVNEKLDEEWNESHDARKRSMKYTTPTLEAIYRPMIKQNEIIRRQMFLIKDLKARVKARNLKQKKNPLLLNQDGVSKITANLKDLNVHPDDVLVARYRLIEETFNKFSKKKENQLKKTLLETKLTRITPSKPSRNKSVLLPTTKSPKISLKLVKEEMNLTAPEKKSITDGITANLHLSTSTAPSTFGTPTTSTFTIQKSQAVVTTSTSSPKLQSELIVPVVEKPETVPMFGIPTTTIFGKSNPESNTKSKSTYGGTPTIPIIGKHTSGSNSTEVVGKPEVKTLFATPTSFSFGKKSSEPIITEDSGKTKPESSNQTSMFVKPQAEKILNKSKSESITTTSAFALPSTPVFTLPKAESIATSLPTFFTTKAEAKSKSEIATTSVTFSTSAASIFSTQKSQSTSFNFGKSVSDLIKTEVENPKSESMLGIPTTSIFNQSKSETDASEAKPEATTSTVLTSTVFITPKSESVSTTPSIFTTSKAATKSDSLTSTPMIVISTASIFTTPKSEPVAAPPSSSSFETPKSAAMASTTATSTTSIFASPKSDAFAIPHSSFATPTSKPAVTSSAFGSPSNFNTPKLETNTSTFGTPTTTSFFGSPKSESVSTFGSPNTHIITTPRFGTPTTSALLPTPAFGTTVTSSFDLGTDVKSPELSFGKLALSPAATTTSTSNFSFVNTTSTGFGQNIFGTTTASTTPLMGAQVCSPFGQFGQSSSGNIFAKSLSTSGQSSGNIFGQGITTGGASIFGQKPTVTSSSNVFGSTTSPATTSPNIFGGTSTSGTTSANIFSSGNNTSAFGQTPLQQSTFGAKPTFGQSPLAASAFSQQSPAFGSTSTFGSNSPFGSQSNSVFGSSPFSIPTQISGAFSSGGQTISQSGFGSPPAFNANKSGFGSPPAFGAATASPGFGSPPTFGGSPAFGSPQKVFGGSPQPANTAPAFGSVQQNATFANLASQNTVGFGNLAQQQPAAPQPQTQFSGGNAFSSWR